DGEGHGAVHRQRLEQLGVHHPPIGDLADAAHLVVQGLEDLPYPVGVDRLQLDHRNAVAEQQQGLRILDRHDGEDLVIIIDPHLEDRGDLVLHDARHGAEGRRRAGGVEDRYLAAHRGAERFRQARADRHLLSPRLQALERSDDFLALE
ncbi:hypothetical protein QU39_00260, partial [Staphylococcus aureus]